MEKQEFGPKRSRATTKPGVTCPKVLFFRCRSCGNTLQLLSAGNPPSAPACCGGEMSPLLPRLPGEDTAELFHLDYKITGGFNENVVQVSWAIRRPDVALEWLYLKTFTGGQLKYPAGGKQRYVFALADEDAYAYCDEDPCLECTFRCKRGFEIFACFGAHGLFRLPLERMNPSWQTR